jgi:Fe-S cluster assembly iron-binding protein IscA
MALDEPTHRDEVVEQNGLRLIVDDRLTAEMGRVELDYATGFFRKGFQLSSISAPGRRSSLAWR